MKLPSSVKVGYADIQIVPMHTLEGFSHGVFGHFSASELAIRVINDLTETQVANTLLHEVLHACWHVAGLEDEDEEERIVTCLANTYLQVLRDNPDYNRFIQKCLNSAKKADKD
jgi:hypothetical protein